MWLAAKREPPGQEASLEEYAEFLEGLGRSADDFLRSSCLRQVTRAERRVAASGATRETRARPVPSLPPPPSPPMCVKPGTPPRAPSLPPPSGQSEAASGAYKWERQLTLIRGGVGKCYVGLAEPAVNIPRDACGDYRAAQERPILSLEIHLDGPYRSFAEELEGHDVAEMMLDWARQPAAEEHRREQAAAQVCHDILELQKLPKLAWREVDDRGSAAEALTIEGALKDHEGEARVWQLA